MAMRCDLHAINREMKIDVRICGTGRPRELYSPFVVLELRVESGWVTLFLTPDQALDLAQSISRFVKLLDEGGELAAEALPERKVS